MEEALIWIPITLAELLLLVSVALVILLKRSRTAQRLMRLQLEDMERASAGSPTAPRTEPLSSRPEPSPRHESTEAYRQIEQLFPATETAEIDRCIEELQQRLNETKECLQTVTAELEKEKTLSDLSHRVLSGLRENLRSMALEVTALRSANGRLQRELCAKRDVAGDAGEADRDSKEKILLYIKRLRDELAMLKLKLSGSEDEVLRLREEKKALSEEHDALTLEYQRLYANFRS